ncbi:WS/DGAT/MGAT family O-acyltransferase [Parahaliea mediterranea]|uniref:WS/DGAT/MGAT family O-acyltransferase n=1 Tax=Parahaliea mediterranea TaxID=651086 RepID=UPI000E2E4E54|nr:wax ester/triacylglycerol synthase family O-acyltransferase [Parahaliea mediterranea]
MRRIELADAGFLYMEKRQTPMHVGGLHLFTLPDGADGPEFLNDLMAVLRTEEPYRKPFGEYVRHGRAGALGPLYWEKDRNFDMDYHVRHSALPRPGRFRELFMLVSRLHSMLLDRNRPLWEMYLIEGLQNRQFALYMKMHHAATDGAGAMHMINAMYATRKTDRTQRSPFSLAAYEEYKTRRRAARQARVVPKEAELRNVAEILREQFDTTANLMGAFRRFGSAFIGRGDGLAVPWHQVPHTSLNTQVTGSRRFVAQSWDFDRIRAVCKAADGTVNDIVLAMCGGALRRYLLAQDELPKHSLKAMTPVSLREESDFDSSNAVGFMVADLATHIADPEGRLRRTQESMRAGKSLLQSLSRREAMLFMQITQVPALLTSLMGLATRFPAFSTVISNVPGPQEQLYWNGARVDGMYPASIVFDGFAMNITLLSYNKQLHFGIVACRRSLPHVQRVIDYLEEALQELEDMVGIRPGGGAAKATNTKTAKAKTTKAKTPRTKAPKAKVTKARTTTGGGRKTAPSSKARPKGSKG